jgi:hypothetical protein
MTAVVINLPQRFQVINGDSPLEAGYRFLALTVVASVGAFGAGFLVQNLRIAPLWVLLGGASLQIIGLVLAGYLPTDYKVPNITYFYEVILGLGFGSSWSTTIMAIPLVVEKRDTGTVHFLFIPVLQFISSRTALQLRMRYHKLTFRSIIAVGMGSSGQFRYLGGSIGIAICTNILNKHVSATLSTLLSPTQLRALLQSTQILNEFPPSLQDAIRRAYAEGYNTQFRAMAGFGGAALLATLLLCEKSPRRP